MTRISRIPSIPAATAVIALAVLATPRQAGAQHRDPLARAMRAEAIRLAEAGPVAASPVPVQDAAGLSAWVRVANLKAGEEIVLTRAGGAPTRQRLLSVQDDGLTVLDVSAPMIESDVAGALERAARSNPDHFAAAWRGDEFDLAHDVHIGRAGVSRNGRHLFPLSLVVIDVPRHEVDRISVVRKHVGAHVRRGLVIGAVVGAVWLGASGLACHHDSYYDCGNPFWWAVTGAAGGGLVGAEHGALVGLAWPRTAELIYQR